ncbi:hypothetical protein [Amycolatopsis sp. La24]|uniref:hypothetical protein n=1 Tax=Amycolatopsis sp. La24 TaxID=3028304 RepID=UPI0023AF8314|nr:hypothetical protein [Amycolatopsis sp. La24]
MTDSAGADDHVIDALPPRPDRETGEPFPPHGLSYFRGGEAASEHDVHRESRLAHRPDPPPGLGPVLAWHRESRRGKIALILTSAAILIAGTLVISLFHRGGLGILTAWPIWAVIVVAVFLISSPFSYFTYAAGADWLMVERTRWGVKSRAWIDTYELTKIDAAYGGTTFHLWLYDKDMGLTRSSEELQRDRRIWDLVYNGILHSVANGAQVSNQAIGILQLGKTPALKMRDAERPDR